MAFTDAELAAAGATPDVSAPAEPRAPRAGAAHGRTKAMQVPIANYETTVAPINSRLSEIANSLGVTGIDENGIQLDHDKSAGIVEGHDPEVAAAVPKQFAYDTRRNEASKSEKSIIPGGAEHTSGETFPEFGERWHGIIPADLEKKKEAEDAYRRVQLFLDKDNDKSAVPGWPGQYLFSREDPASKKAEVRKLMAQRITDLARQLPDQGGGKELRERAAKLAAWLETQDPKLLAPGSQTAHIVQELAQHASPPVRRAIKTSIKDALLTGFGNNVAPMTMGLGSMIAQAAGGGGEVRAPGADVITRDPRTGLETTSRAPAGGGAAQTGADVDRMHAALVEELTGKSPDEQAAYIAQLKREHPILYAAAAGAGMVADPVGLAGGVVAKGLSAGAKALGAGEKVAALAGGAPVAATEGVLGGRAAGSDSDLANAALGLGAGAVAAGGARAARWVAKLASGAPKRIAQEEINEGARKILLARQAAAHQEGITLGEGKTDWQHIVDELTKEHPDLPRTRGRPAHPETGRAQPNVAPEIAHAADVATTHTAAAPTGAGAVMHPFVTLGNPNATTGQLARDFVHEAALHGPMRPAVAVAAGRAGAIANAGDKFVAPLVNAIRKGDRAEFLRVAHEQLQQGASQTMIDAATAAFHRRNGGH